METCISIPMYTYECPLNKSTLQIQRIDTRNIQVKIWKQEAWKNSTTAGIPTFFFLIKKNNGIAEKYERKLEKLKKKKPDDT